MCGLTWLVSRRRGDVRAVLIGARLQLRLHSQQNVCNVARSVCADRAPCGCWRRYAGALGRRPHSRLRLDSCIATLIVIITGLAACSSKCWLITLDGGAGCAVVEQPLLCHRHLQYQRFANLSVWETLAALFCGVLVQMPHVCDCAALCCVCRTATIPALVVSRLLLWPHNCRLPFPGVP